MDKTMRLITIISGLFSLFSCCSCQYHFVNMAKTWSQAQLYCRQNYGDLVTIGDQTGMDKLINALPAAWSGPAWIGLYNISWTWSLTDTQLEGSGFWDVGQPDNVNDNDFCVYMSNKKWSDANCDLQQHFVCYDKKTNSYILARDPINYNILSMSWTQAKIYCRTQYTDLAIVTDATLSAVQNAILQQSYGQAGLVVWIGLYREWRWSDKSGSLFRNWDSGKPIGAGPGKPQGQFCGEVQFPSGRWSDDNCVNTHPFICTDATTATTQSTGLSSFPSCLSNQYEFVNMAKTWSQAQLYCRQNYGDLVTIGDQTEMDKLINALPAGWSGPAWIGLYNISWTWSLNDTQLEGSGFWDVGQPDNVNDNEFCVYMSNKKWSDANCDGQQHFVCYDAKTNSYILARDPINYNILSMSWTQAQIYCRTQYTDLATVTDATLSAVQNAILQQSYGQSGLVVWIGLYREWRWSDQSGSLFRNWDSGKPIGAGPGKPQGQFCGEVQFPSGLWRDDNCVNTHPFICADGKNKVFKFLCFLYLIKIMMCL
ncbi:C-type mannose receptor 2 isoform X2 [Esox lucius]|uniref:C-type mannose receptor 2 isoform X2 n=1 Tax=Esox lucius TaxID=8010 RepID=UPI001476B2ED|nr:C-type mannose receptor 2 isoform X2 [Esox lucius]